ncbi:MAG: DUF169 domain-containing protein [Archaeoglobaceae archaeon]
MDFRSLAAKLQELLKLRTPPVGVKFLESEEVPENAFKPSRFGIKVAVCQAIGIARHLRRLVAMTAEDFACPPAMLLYGVARSDGGVEEILFEAEWVCKGCEVSVKTLPPGKYKVFLFGDATQMDVEPDAILVFGTPEQVGRLIQARTYYGGSVRAELIAKTASCAEALFPALSGEVTISVPGAGDRVFAGIGSDEMIFAMPTDWLQKIVEALKVAGRGANVSYPVPPFLLFTPRFPKKYREIAEKFRPS